MDDRDDDKAGARVWAMRIVAALVALALLLAAGVAVKSLFDGKGGAPKKPPKVSLLPNTPPPPPPPPKEEKRPEPPKEQKEVKVEQPQEQKNEPPPDQTLKMEGAAGDGPSSFGSGKVASEDLGKIGQPGVVGGTGTGPARTAMVDPFNVYATSIKGELQRLLARRADLKKRRYGIEVNLWVGEDGRVARYELLGTTSDDDTDAAIRNALASLPPFADAPPPKMPQPVRLRIVAGGRV
jgi:protein TonB